MQIIYPMKDSLLYRQNPSVSGSYFIEDIYGNKLN